MDNHDLVVNPWAVEQIEDFLYFCCPECDTKNKSKDSFLEHALNQHPSSKETLLKVSVKAEDDELFAIKEEEGEVRKDYIGYQFTSDLEESNYEVDMKDKDVDLDYYESEGEVFDCDLCEKSFQTQTSLKIHVARIHQKKKTKSKGDTTKNFKSEEQLESKSSDLTGNDQDQFNENSSHEIKCELCDGNLKD